MSGNANDTNNPTSQRVNCHETEASLPSYEEVVTSGHPHNVQIGFKTDVLLPSSSAEQGQSSTAAGASSHEDRGAPRESRCKPTRTFLVILGLLLIPMCGLIIILQLKVCNKEYFHVQETIDKLNTSYIECTAEVEDFQERLYSNEILISDLEYKLDQMTKQRDIYKAMIYDKSSKANSLTNLP